MPRSQSVLKAQRKYRIKHPYCILCGSSGSGTTHHLIAYSLGGSKDDNNFVTLCRKHHDLVEAGVIQISRSL